MVDDVLSGPEASSPRAELAAVVAATFTPRPVKLVADSKVALHVFRRIQKHLQAPPAKRARCRPLRCTPNHDLACCWRDAIAHGGLGVRRRYKSSRLLRMRMRSGEFNGT